MNYNRLIFWTLFALVYVAYWRLDRRRQNALLLVVSYVFYGFWDYRFVFLILLSTVIDFIGGLGVAGVRLSARRLVGLGALLVASSLALCSHIDYALLWSAVRGGGHVAAALPHRLADFAIPLAVTAAGLVYATVLPIVYRARARRTIFLVISMVANLGILGFFKYCGFFLVTFHHVMDAIGLPVSVPVLSILLPAGISFYTFQAMSYTIDIYRGELAPTERFADFALFVCFFPHLVAGPIMRAHTLLPQVQRPRHRRAGDLQEGFALVAIGLFKKLVLSDNLAPLVNATFFRLAQDRADLTGAEVLVGLYAFAFQIYGDFSGYSAIARGISKWLGFDLVVNFHLPYLAVTPSDFWKRWHISLSSWLRDYLYVPLGGNRHGKLREHRNLMITMLLGGLWHGASWTFVAWGLYHGVLLCGQRLLRVRTPRPVERGRWLAQVLIMFHVTCLGWLLFRAEDFASVGHALVLMTRHFAPTRVAAVSLALVVFYAGALFMLELFLDGEERLDRLAVAPSIVRRGVYAWLAMMVLFFPAERSYEFIYFQF